MFRGSLYNQSCEQMFNPGSRKLTLKDDGSIRTDEDCYSAGTASRTSSTLCVDGDVTGDDNGVPSIPRGGFDPVDSVEESCR